MRPKKFIITKLDLTEISGVDSPAQPTARATIMKRSPEHSVGDSDEVSTLVTEENIQLTNDVEKSVDESAVDSAADLEKAFDEKLAAAINAAYDAMFAFEPSEYELVKAMSKEEKDELMSLSPEERKKKLKAAIEGEEVAKFEGREVRKSSVGEDTFHLYKRLEAMEIQVAKEREAKELEVAKAKEAEELAKLEKRASEEFGNLPGDASEIAAVLKALTSLDEEVAKSIEAIMKVANEAHETAFVEKGVKKAPEADDVEVKKAALNTKIEDIMKSRSVSKSKAFEIVAAENPELI